MADEREEIRARIDIVDLVGQRVALKRVGKDYQGLCPFHDDKRPSFRVSSVTGYYKCYACQESGDIFAWVMKTQNVDFVEALQILATKAGVTLTRQNHRSPSEKAQQQAAMAEACAYFREQLSKSSAANEYCERRGLDRATLDHWEIGYAPDVGDALANHLKKKGFALADCKTLFLVDHDPSGGYFDKFKGRLMFPIRDERGELCAFGGRLFGDGIPKYINSSDTPLYKKSRVLYGMHHAKNAISKLRKAVLVEGYLDVVACHRAGVTNALASLGTALSEEHARLLKRWCESVTILYDSDAAGQKAAVRAVDILSEAGLRVRVAALPDGQDPDTLLTKIGPAAVVDVVEQNLSPVAFELHALMSRREPADQEFWVEAVQILARSKTRLELDEHVERLAAIYPGSKDRIETQRSLRADVVSAMRVQKRTSGPGQISRPRLATKLAAGAMSAYEIAIFKGLLDEALRPNLWAALSEDGLMESESASVVAAALVGTYGASPPVGPAKDWIHTVVPPSAGASLAEVEFDARIDPSEPVVNAAVAELKKRRSSRAIAEIKGGELTEERLAEVQRQLRSRIPGADSN